MVSFVLRQTHHSLIRFGRVWTCALDHATNFQGMDALNKRNKHQHLEQELNKVKIVVYSKKHVLYISVSSVPSSEGIWYLYLKPFFS